MKTEDFINKYQESAEKYEYDDEVGMVQNNLHTIIRVLTHLSKETVQNEDFPEWVQEKIAMIKQTSVEVMNYMVSQHEMGHTPEVPGFDTQIAESKFLQELAEDKQAISEMTAGGTGSASVAVSMEGGAEGPFSKKDLNKKLGNYTNVISRGGVVKGIKK